MSGGTGPRDPGSSSVKRGIGTSDEGCGRGRSGSVARCHCSGGRNRPRPSADRRVARARTGRVGLCVRHRLGPPGLESGGAGRGLRARNGLGLNIPGRQGPGAPLSLWEPRSLPRPHWGHWCRTCRGDGAPGQAGSRTCGFTSCSPVLAPSILGPPPGPLGCAPPLTAAAGAPRISPVGAPGAGWPAPLQLEVTGAAC